MKVLWAFFFAFIVGCIEGRGAGFCALTVSVTNGPKQSVDGTIIELLDTLGQVVMAKRSEGPQARFCDFGPQVAAIRVGRNDCFPVTISNLHFIFGESQRVEVYLNQCSGVDTISNFCPVVLRIRSPESAALADAIVSEPGKKQTADQFGRVGSGILRNRSRTYHAEADGYKGADITLACPKELRTIDEVVELRHR